MSVLPYEDSSYANAVDWIFVLETALCTAITCVVLAVFAWFCFRYRHGSRVDRTPDVTSEREIQIEFAWILIPLVIFLGLFIWAGNVYYNMFSPPADGIPIYVIAKQWMWKIEHADGIREINELHIPAGRNIVLTLTSQDVIHDFDVPAFRIKHDVLPGRYVRMWFRATTPGQYHLFCGQYCGAFHSQMVGTVVVMSLSDYAAWEQRAGASAPGTLAAQGSRYFHSLGCSGCHEGSQVVHAPSLDDIYGQPVPLQSGQIVVADDTYIRDCILEPAKNVPAGYQPIMPSFQGHLTEEQIVSLIAYIKSMRSDSAATQGGSP
ncbi:MAG TPA: cytochrome c oxidase subunit II [Candidatus Methylacidiphilales bacterium]|nr:cytochrome c oxidase subunit II [Candidatus Methylacidiphilales bacterium]